MKAARFRPVLDPNQLRQLEKDWQDEIGHTLLDKPFEQPGSALVYRRQFERIGAALDGIGPGMLVEIGCGRGQLLEHLRQTPLGRERLLVGVDISVSVSALPERGVAGVRADGEFLPFRDECASAVVYNGSLHHVVDYRTAVREALRILKPGGRLVIFEPVSSAFSRAAHRVLDPIVFRTSLEYESPVDQHLKHAFREDVVAGEIEASGASIRRETSDFLAYPFTGCYAGSLFTRSLRLMRGLLALERVIEDTPVLRTAARVFAWRFLLVATKPGTSHESELALADVLVCPKCRRALAWNDGALNCDNCRLSYAIEGKIPVLIANEARRLPR